MCFQPPRIPKHRLLNERDYSNPLFQRRRQRSPLIRWSLLIVAIFAAFIFAAENTRADTGTTVESSSSDSPYNSKAGQLFLRLSVVRALHVTSKLDNHAYLAPHEGAALCNALAFKEPPSGNATH